MHTTPSSTARLHATPSPGGHDPQWWVFPAIFSPLALLLAYVDHVSTPLPGLWACGVLLPILVVAATWLLPPVRRHRDTRLALGIGASVAAFFYGKVLMAVVFVIGIAVWLKVGD